MDRNIIIYCTRWTTVRGLEETPQTATQFLGPDCY